METANSFCDNPALNRGIRFKKLAIIGNLEKKLIKVNGGGSILIIEISSIISCKIIENILIIHTNGGKRIEFKADTNKGRIDLKSRLNRELSNCGCEFKFDDEIQFLQSPQLPKAPSQNLPIMGNYTKYITNKRIVLLFITIISLGINLSYCINQKSDVPVVTKPKKIDNSSVFVRDEYAQKYKKQVQPEVLAPRSQSNDTEIASVIVSASCAGKSGLILRSEMGSMMKSMFNDKGIDSTAVFDNWDYYWNIAKEMDAYNKTYCLK